VLIPSAAILVELCYQLLDVSFNVPQLLTDIYLLVLRVLTAALWHLICAALQAAADKALQNFQLVCWSITLDSETICTCSTHG
jgi:hypothetical protein